MERSTYFYEHAKRLIVMLGNVNTAEDQLKILKDAIFEIQRLVNLSPGNALNICS
jgi:hypothetical protein